MQIVLYTTDRHPKDVVRSFSHELVHHNQNCNGKFDQTGEMGEGYAQSDPLLREMEKEAYLEGNIIFRDATDTGVFNLCVGFERPGEITMKEVFNKRHSVLNKRLMEKWGIKQEEAEEIVEEEEVNEEELRGAVQAILKENEIELTEEQLEELTGQLTDEQIKEVLGTTRQSRAKWAGRFSGAKDFAGRMGRAFQGKATAGKEDRETRVKRAQTASLSKSYKSKIDKLMGQIEGDMKQFGIEGEAVDNIKSSLNSAKETLDTAINAQATAKTGSEKLDKYDKRNEKDLSRKGCWEGR